MSQHQRNLYVVGIDLEKELATGTMYGSYKDAQAAAEEENLPIFSVPVILDYDVAYYVSM